MGEIEKRAQTLADRLKARAGGLAKREMEEVCIILVDNSGSMHDPCPNGETKLEAVKRAIPYLQARGSYVGYGMVSYSDTAVVIQRVTTNFTTLLIQSDRLGYEGSTNIPAALRVGRLVIEEYGNGGKKRMILLSDGKNNLEGGRMDEEIERCVAGGIVVDSISFGDQADRILMATIAKRTGGIYTHADSPLALQEAYQKLNYQVRYLTHQGGEK